MEREDDQELWDLLGRTAEPKVSPFFARNVVRKVRQEGSRSQWAETWFSLRQVAAPVAGVAIVVIGIAIASHYPVLHKSSDMAPDVVAKIDPQDYDVVADLDELISLDENSLWDDKSNKSTL